MAACLAADLWWPHSAFIPLPIRDRAGPTADQWKEKKTPIMEEGKKSLRTGRWCPPYPHTTAKLYLCVTFTDWALSDGAFRLERLWSYSVIVCHPHTNSNYLLQTIQINNSDGKTLVRNKIDEFHGSISYILIQTAPVFESFNDTGDNDTHKHALLHQRTIKFMKSLKINLISTRFIRTYVNF